MRPRLSLVLLALPLCAAGCLNLTRQSPPVHRFMLEAARPQTTAPAAGAPALAVPPLTAAPACAGKELVYRTGEFAYEKDFYNQWLEEPATAVTLATQGWLARSGLFAHVVGSAAGVRTPYVLRGELLALHGDYRRAGSPVAVLHVRFLLLKGGGSQAEIALQRDYEETAPAGDGSPAALAGALSQALTKALQALEKDVASALSGGA